MKGQKISKSMPATRVDPLAIAGEMGVDPLRYFVLREYTFGGDGDFTYEALFQRYQSDLGNDLGNLLNRTLSMVHKYRRRHAARPRVGKSGVRSNCCSWRRTSWDSFNPSGALEATWRLIRAHNQKIDEEKPWVLHKNGQTDRPDGRSGRLLRGAALGGAAGRAGDCRPPRAKSCGSSDVRRTKGPGRRRGAGRAARSPSRRRCSRASNPIVRPR